MLKRSLLILGAAGLSFLVLRSQQIPALPPPALTVLASFGLKAKADERWDGSIQLTNAKLIRTYGRHFSKGDEIRPGGSWSCTTRRDAVAPFADIHYTEMRPGSIPEVLHKPVGLYFDIEPQPGGRIALTTPRGRFEFGLTELTAEPKSFADGAASIRLVPAPMKLSTDAYEDDEPSIAFLPNGDMAVAWVAYRDRADRVLLRTLSKGSWSAPEEVSKPADIFRTSMAAAANGQLYVLWSERQGEPSAPKWTLMSRRKLANGSWDAPQSVSTAGSATFHRAAASGNTLHAVWQSFVNGQSDIYLRTNSNGAWGAETRLSDSPANDWEPAVAAGPDGVAHVVWDSYHAGNYDIYYRSSKIAARAVTSSPNFQAHSSVAVDSSGHPWIAWNESGINWGKDQGFLIPVPLATPLHQQRWLNLAVWTGSGFQTPAAAAPHMDFNAEHPQLAFAGSGALVMAFRHWTRQQSRSIGSPVVWENYLTTFDGTRWSEPQPVPHSGGWIEKLPALARDPQGRLWAAWMTDNRPFETMRPENSDVFAAWLPYAPVAQFSSSSLKPFQESFEEAIPVHNNETQDVSAIRAYTISSGGKSYKIHRGDMHRHTDFSQDFKYDGSLFEVYRYGLDAAGFDYIAPTDHQTGYDQEFSWWLHQKYVDLFYVHGKFVPLFAYERSLRFPNGHRNIVWAQRGVRTFPIPPEEASGREGAKKLFEHLRQTNGISMPHSSATSQGTDWRDNDKDVEPLIEIFQGYRNSYEYEGAPRAATTLNQHAQKSGWQPEGFWWNALEKGYKLGVQASSDHWSTHISYGCLLSEAPTREALLDAIRNRHAYAATDNVILDVRARSAGKEYIMGDIFTAAQSPQISVKVQGTNAIKQIDLISNKRFLYTIRPGTKSARFTFSDKDLRKGESWYYVRVLQEDGQLAWSSPMWITKQ